MRKFISSALLVLIGSCLAIIGGTSAATAATTCESQIASTYHLWVRDANDYEGTGNFIWDYCNVSPGQDYIVIKTLGGNYNMHNSSVKCEATSFTGGMVGFRVQLILPDETVTMMVPCDSDGINGKTADIANRYFYASTPCAYAPNDGCRAALSYKMKLTFVVEGIADTSWTSGYKYLGP